jgi:hypothetical protein
MTRPTFTRQSRGDVDLSDMVPWLNVSGELIPAHAVVQLRTNFASGLSQASKPNSTSGIFFTNGPASVGVGGKGESQLWTRPRRVLVTESLTVGDEVGPVEDSWEMTTEGSGFRVIHQDNSGIATVLPVGGGGGGGHHIWFTIDEVICDPYTLATTLIATPTFYSRGCSAAIPGTNSYGQVEVSDICSILTYYRAEWLKSGGVVGRATYMYPRDGYCEPLWLVDAICGTPECA